MINVGDSNISVYVGDTELTVYAGDVQIYPMNLGTLTGITLDNLTWVTDIPADGGTATSANCSFIVTAHYDSGKTRRVTKDATVTGSLVVPSTVSDTREIVGTLTLTASYSGFTNSDSVDVYQMAVSYNNLITYTTTNNQILPKDFSSYPYYISHSYNNGVGKIYFSQDLTTVSDGLFSGCTTLSTVTLPETVTSYGYRAFYNCNGLTEFHISSAITSISASCFYECSGVLTIESEYVTRGVTGAPDSKTNGFAYKFCGSWGSDGSSSSEIHMNFDKVIITGDTITNIGTNAFHSSPATEYVLGDKVKSTGYMALARMMGGDPAANKESVLNHKPLETLTIGSGFTTPGQYWLFYGPLSLTRINYYPPTANISVTSGWFGSTRTASVHYKEGNTGKISGLPNWFTVYYDL